MKELDLLQLFLPEELAIYFELTKVELADNKYIIYLSEKNEIPDIYKDNKLLSKGFFEEITIQDYPLRGKACFLKVKRRRWHNVDTGEIVFRNWNIVAKGTRLTSDFATFLKGINR